MARPEFPIYVGDAWDTGHYAEWVGKRDDFVVLDHHLYRCFTDQDKRDSGDKHAARLQNGPDGSSFGHSSAAAKGSLVVAEWSGSLDAQSLGDGPDGEKDRQRREFVRAQLDLFEAKSAGWWYWTYRKEKGWDAGWSAKDATRAEILPGRVGRQVKGRPAEGQKEDAMRQGQGEFPPATVGLELRSRRCAQLVLEQSWRISGPRSLLTGLLARVGRCADVSLRARWTA